MGQIPFLSLEVAIDSGHSLAENRTRLTPSRQTMPQTDEFVLPGVPPVQGIKPDAPQNQNRRIRTLASLAVQTGEQDEFLTIQSKVEFRFMDEFVAPVREWCRDHSGKISACFISVYED